MMLYECPGPNFMVRNAFRFASVFTTCDNFAKGNPYYFQSYAHASNCQINGPFIDTKLYTGSWQITLRKYFFC